MSERWVPVPGYEGFYEVSDQGRVRSVDRWVTYSDGQRRFYRGQVLAQAPMGSYGHLAVPLSRDGRTRTLYVHRLVMLAFVGPCPPGLEVCHGPGGKFDGRLVNLRYDTSSANTLDAVHDGTFDNGFRSRLCCPQDHLLVAPNLMPSRLPVRACLSCSRAGGRIRSLRRAGRPVPELRVLSDAIYAEIMAA